MLLAPIPNGTPHDALYARVWLSCVALLRKSSLWLAFGIRAQALPFSDLAISILPLLPRFGEGPRLIVGGLVEIRTCNAADLLLIAWLQVDLR